MRPSIPHAWILPALALCLLAPPCWAQQTAQRMDQVVKSYADAHEFTGSVLVAKADQILFAKAYGFANLEWDIPNSTTTKFRIGSTTKQFTAAAILLLAERGKLRLDAPLKAYLPGIPSSWNAITIYQLLTHTSGITELTALSGFDAFQLAPATPEKTLAFFWDQPLDFPPGEQFSYSNSGYIVLGAVIEKVSGQGYEQFIRENIFVPLGMRDSGYDTHSVVLEQRASGYAGNGDLLSNAVYINMSVPFSAGGLYSTTEDLLRWNRALFGQKLLSASSIAQMTKPAKLDYGMGLTMMMSRGRHVIQHGGVIEGFKTFLAYYPESEVTVAVLANSEASRPAVITGLLGALAHGDKVTPPAEWQEISVPRQILKRYAGTYQSTRPEKDKFIIKLAGDQLTAHRWDGDIPVKLVPRSHSTFLAAQWDTEFEFIKDNRGTVDQINLVRGHFDDKALRLPAGQPD